MSDFNYIPLGLNIPSQIPLDAKQYVINESYLKNLGSSDQLAFTYVKGYIFYCIQEGTRFEWREVLSWSTEKGLMDNDYVYPDNVIVFGIDYSLKSYNFFRIDYENKKYFQSGSNTTLEGDGSEQNPFKYNAVQIQLSAGSNISFTGIGTEADPLVINAIVFTQQNTDWNAVSGVTELLNKPNHFPPSAHTHSIADIDYLQSFLDKAELKENKGVPLGYVPLNIFGKIDEQYIERERNEYVNFKGYYNASLNIPELPLANTVKGHYYEILEDGIFQLIDYKKGDWIISDGNSWKRVSNQEYNDEKAQIAVVSRYIRFDVENKSPSEKAVFDALATKAPIVHTHTVSQITDFPTFKTIENQSIIGTGNIDLDKASVGLGNVDNTSDLLKPISTATQTALNAKANISGQVFTGAVSATNLSGTNTGDNAPNSLYSGLISNATHTGDVTGATALTITNGVVTNSKLASVATATIKGRVTAGTGVVEDLTASQIRTLLNVANGANNYVHPANHPASIITQDASNRFVTDTEKSTWNTKEPSIAPGTISQYWRGDKTWQPFPTIQTVDAIPTDGSNNAVSSNGVFDALATKAPISSVHNPVTLGAANGLSLSTQVLSLGLASSGVAGALSGADWTTFNSKFNTPTGLITNYLPKWNGSGFGNSSVFDNGINVGIGTTNPTANLTVKGAYSVGSSIPTNWALLSAGRTGVANNNKGLYFDIFNDYAEVSTYDWSLGQAYPMVFQGNGGNSMFGTNVDNGVDRVQVAGTITASPAVSPNQVPVLSQVATLTGNQTIAGTKTFSSPVKIPNGVNPNEGVNKGQLDAVASSGSYTIPNVSTFKNLFVRYCIINKVITLTVTGTCDFTASASLGTIGAIVLPSGYTINTANQQLGTTVASAICDSTNNKTFLRTGSNSAGLDIVWRGVSTQANEMFAMTCQILLN